MDSSAVEISFDDHGFCKYCCELEVRAPQALNTEQRIVNRERLLAEIRSRGRKSKYDCIIGVSGGIDSSWALYLAVKEGLRPLAVHMDNGWNSELAVNNIEVLVRKLGVDLYTHVIDWDEYRNLMQAFFDANVIDVELLYDNAMLAVNYRLSADFGLHHILAGTNQATEGLHMPPSWNWLKFDKTNIQSITRKYAPRTKITTLPTIGTFDYLRFRFLHRISWISFLDYFEYNKQYAVDKLQTELGFKPYPYKHYESIFTRFYQGHLLPLKFGVDKRRLHFSSLIMSGQMSREDALTQLAKAPYANPKDLQHDIEYFLKKMKWSREMLEEYIARPAARHDHVATEKPLWDYLLKIHQRLQNRRERTSLPGNPQT